MQFSRELYLFTKATFVLLGLFVAGAGAWCITSSWHERPAFDNAVGAFASGAISTFLISAWWWYPSCEDDPHMAPLITWLEAMNALFWIFTPIVLFVLWLLFG